MIINCVGGAKFRQNQYTVNNGDCMKVSGMKVFNKSLQ